MVRKKLLTAYSRCFISTKHYVNAIVIQLIIVKKQSGIKTKKTKKIFLLKKTICLKNYVIQIISVFTLPSGFVLIMTGYKKNPTKQLERR